jgi:hypothetical protein
MKKKTTSPPEDFKPSEALFKWAEQEEYWKANLGTLAEECFDHHDARGNEFVKWEATIRTWCRNDKKWYPEKYKEDVFTPKDVAEWERKQMQYEESKRGV